jgi:ABC-type multidrug transport system ATPase subunit
MLRRVTTVTTSVFTSAGRKYTVSGAVMGLKGDRRLVLQGAHGRVHMGDMVAVMGGSGSGKSTLLEILAGKCDQCDSGSVMCVILLCDFQPSSLLTKQCIRYAT